MRRQKHIKNISSYRLIWFDFQQFMNANFIRCVPFFIPSYPHSHVVIYTGDLQTVFNKFSDLAVQFPRRARASGVVIQMKKK